MRRTDIGRRYWRITSLVRLLYLASHVELSPAYRRNDLRKLPSALNGALFPDIDTPLRNFHPDRSYESVCQDRHILQTSPAHNATHITAIRVNISPPSPFFVRAPQTSRTGHAQSRGHDVDVFAIEWTYTSGGRIAGLTDTPLGGLREFACWPGKYHYFPPSTRSTR